MTVAHPHVAARSHARAPELEPRPVNWAAVGVVVAIAMHLGAGVWFAASLSTRVHAIEEQLPPGSIQRLQDRTDQVQARLDTLIQLEQRR